MAWAKNGTPDTLGGTADVVSISDMSGLDFNVILTNIINSGTVNALDRNNADSGTNYASRYSVDGGADSTSVSRTDHLSTSFSFAYPIFMIQYEIGITAEEKLIIKFFVGQNTAGAASAPRRVEIASKWANTSDDITGKSITNSDSGDYAADSNLSALGTD